MIFSDQTIKEFILAGKIKIFPEFDLSNIRPAGIRLHLGSELLIPVSPQTVDLNSQDTVQYDRIAIPSDGFILKPGQFVLGSTHERFRVPLNVVCHVDGRSTVARLGLAIHCTSGMIDGNYEEARSIVLEIQNQGPFDLVLKAKTALALLSFAQLTTNIEQSTQKQYQGQEGVEGPNLQQQKR